MGDGEQKVTLFCGGGSLCCPVLTLREDGSAQIVGDEGETIDLNAHQADQLEEALREARCRRRG